MRGVVSFMAREGRGLVYGEAPSLNKCVYTHVSGDRIWEMGNGRRGMGEGEWEKGNGRWRMGDGMLRIT